MQLYHGSKSGIDGEIRPISRSQCDFGRGFYMGTEESQPLTLICNFEKPVLYTVEFNMDGLDVVDLPLDNDWAMFIAYCRGRLDVAKGTALYDRMRKLETSHDVIVGAIANDRMFIVLDRFFNGEITDVALVHSLSALQLGKQYAAKTERACRQITIVDERPLDEAERNALKEQSDQQRAEGIAQAERICREYRREGRFFDELLEDEA